MAVVAAAAAAALGGDGVSDVEVASLWFEEEEEASGLFRRRVWESTEVLDCEVLARRGGGAGVSWDDCWRGGSGRGGAGCCGRDSMVRRGSDL